VTPPRVSVILPVFDGERFLGQALDAILAQTFGDFEVIAVDDGSTDATPAILAAAAARDPRVRIRRLARSGHTRATRHAIDLARGELLAHCDHDDVWLPTRLERGVAFLDAFPDVAVVGTGATVVDANDRPLGSIVHPCDPDEMARRLPVANAICHSSVLSRASAVRAVGGHREAFRHASDYDLWLRLSERYRLANLPDPLVRYRVHFGNMTVVDPESAGGGGVAARAAARARREGRPDVIEERPYEVSELLRVVGADPAEVLVEGFGLALYLAELARGAQAREAERVLLARAYGLGRRIGMSKGRARHLIERAATVHAESGRPGAALRARWSARAVRWFGPRALLGRAI